MKMKFVFSLVALSYSFLLFSSTKDERFPQLFGDVTIPLVKEGMFESSCQYFSDASEESLFAGKIDNYFFFSLSQHLLDKNKKHEFRFYSTKVFSGKPAYVLDKEGLKRGDNVICTWKKPYDEKYLYSNYLTECTVHIKGQQFANVVHLFWDYKGDQNAYDDTCSVVRVSDYHVEGGQYYYKTDIYSESFYLDTTDMPDLANGKSFYSTEKRLKYVLDQRATEIETLQMHFKKFRASSHYTKIVSCFRSKDADCLSNIWGNQFYTQVATAGVDKICENREGKETEKIPQCGKDFKEFRSEIDSVIYLILKDIIEDITFMRTENYYIKNKKIYYRIPRPHRQMFDPVMEISVDEDGLRLVSFNDGQIC